MPLTPEEILQRKQDFSKHTEHFRTLGHDRLAAVAFVAESGGTLDGPALDVGTGKGLLAMALARQVPEVVTVDVNAEDQALAALLAEEAGLSGKIRFLLRDAASLPFQDGHFGTCAMMDVLHHLGSGAAVLSEMERVLRPGGIFLVSDFTREGLDVVGRVHASEGREHPAGPVSVQWTEGYLSGLGLEPLKSLEGELHRVAVFRKPPGPMPSLVPRSFSGMSRPELLLSLDAFAKNWLAHDGCWFLAAEERLGMDAAMDLDARSWARFAAAEARRIMETFRIPRGGGLEALEKALGLRMYAFLNPQRTEWAEGRSSLRFTMEDCRVQEARRRKGLSDFPCKSVGEVEFSNFAAAVDPRIRVRCLHCPPGRPGELGCAWEFSLEKEDLGPDRE